MRSRKNQIWAVLLLTVVGLTALAGTVYAYLSNISEPVSSDMTPATDFDPNIADATHRGTNIVQNLAVDIGTPGYPVYVRAAIVVTWENEDGKVYAQPPVAGTDYELNWNNADWFYGDDGFYYHEKMVESGNDTEFLINSLTQKADADPPADGYSIHVEIVVQTIQALGTTDGTNIPAVTDAWGVAVDPTSKELINS